MMRRKYKKIPWLIALGVVLCIVLVICFILKDNGKVIDGSISWDMSIDDVANVYEDGQFLSNDVYVVNNEKLYDRDCSIVFSGSSSNHLLCDIGVVFKEDKYQIAYICECIKEEYGKSVSGDINNERETHTWQNSNTKVTLIYAYEEPEIIRVDFTKVSK